MFRILTIALFLSSLSSADSFAEPSLNGEQVIEEKSVLTGKEIKGKLVLKNKGDELLKIHGVGRKIADCILAYSLDKSDSFPVDRHVLSGLIKWYGLPEKTNPVVASDFARKKFGDLSSYAQQYIFHRQRLASRALLWGGRHKSLAIDNDID